jgi:hypothetical protein
MFTEYLIPAAFKNSSLFNIVVLQLIVGIILGAFYFAKEIILGSVLRLIDTFTSLLFSTWDAIVVLLMKTLMIPLNLTDAIIIQYLPFKKAKIEMIESLLYETHDEQLYMLISEKLSESRTYRELVKLEEGIVHYLNNKKYLEEDNGKDEYETIDILDDDDNESTRVIQSEEPTHDREPQLKTIDIERINY